MRNRQCPDGHCLFFCLNDGSFFDYSIDQIAAKAVADIVQILCVPDENVRLLARLDGADAVGAADGGGAVERHRGQRLLGRPPVAQAAQALLLEISGNKYIFLLIVNVIFLIAGCFVDANSAMYIFIPIMYPVATQLGIDPVHFGVIATVNLAIGQVTPPVGVNLFVAIGVSEKLQGLRDKTKVTIVSMSKAVWPQIVACIIALLLITYVPWFSTVLLFGK